MSYLDKLKKIFITIFFIGILFILPSLSLAEETTTGTGSNAPLKNIYDSSDSIKRVRDDDKCDDGYFKYGSEKNGYFCQKKSSLLISYCEYWEQLAPTDYQKFYCTDLLEGVFMANLPAKEYKSGTSLSDDELKFGQTWCIRGEVSTQEILNNNESPFKNSPDTSPPYRSDDTICRTIISTGGFSVFEFYLSYFYSLALNIGSILAVVIIIFAGLLYSISGLQDYKETAQNMIIGSISGLILLLLLGLILRLVNPTFFT